jgi:hypothetical protein
MASRLITAGCSFAYGFGLTDPESQSWPTRLADRLNMDLINLAVPGAGNIYIAGSIVDATLPDALYVISWSHWNRMDFCDADGNLLHLSPSTRRNISLRDAIYPTYCNEDHQYRRFIQTVLMLQGWLMVNDVPFLMFDAMDHLHRGRPLDVRVDARSYIGYGTHSFDSWTDPNDRLEDGHPNAAAHAQMADVLYQELVNRYGEQ